MAKQIMRITLKAYDHTLVDQSAEKIVENCRKTGSLVNGPVPLPTKKEIITILRAVHKYKDSREQFEQRTHKRLIDVIDPSPKTMDSLQRLDMPAGVYIDVQMKTEGEKKRAERKQLVTKSADRSRKTSSAKNQKSGQKTAKTARQAAEVKAEVREKAAEAKAEVKEKAAEVKAEVKKKAAEAKAEVKEKAAEVKAEVKEKAAEVKAAAKAEATE